jgi:hypothetical protein
MRNASSSRWTGGILQAGATTPASASACRNILCWQDACCVSRGTPDSKASIGRRWKQKHKCLDTGASQQPAALVPLHAMTASAGFSPAPLIHHCRSGQCSDPCARLLCPCPWSPPTFAPSPFLSAAACSPCGLCWRHPIPGECCRLRVAVHCCTRVGVEDVAVWPQHHQCGDALHLQTTRSRACACVGVGWGGGGWGMGRHVVHHMICRTALARAHSATQSRNNIGMLPLLRLPALGIGTTATSACCCRTNMCTRCDIQGELDRQGSGQQRHVCQHLLVQTALPAPTLNFRDSTLRSWSSA